MKTNNTSIDKHFIMNINYKSQKMDTVNSHSNSIDRANTAYFINLIRIALADDVISSQELELLYRVSKRLGLTEEEADHLIRTTGKSDYIPPSDLRARFEQIFEIVNMTLIDGAINKNEMYLASSFAAKSGFNEKEIPAILVLLLNGVRKGQNIDELYKEFQGKVIENT